MSRFSLRQLQSGRSELAHVLVQARQARGLKLPEVSRKLKIPTRYLAALEAGESASLPAGNYGRYFLRRYAEFLGVEFKPLWQQYGLWLQSTGQPGTTLSKLPVFSTSLSRPPWLRRAIFSLAALVIVGYLLVAAVVAFLPPVLSLVSPQTDLTTSEPVLSVSGLTEVGVQLTINGERVEVTNQGRFNRQVPLRPGLNTITVSAAKSYSRPSLITRQVLFTPQVAPSSGGDSVVP